MKEHKEEEYYEEYHDNGVCGGTCARDMRCECCTCSTVRYYVWAAVRIAIVLVLIAGAFKLGVHMGARISNGGEWGDRGDYGRYKMMRDYNENL
jgi:hypothetical protein